jgi:hemerythrin
VNHFLEWLDDWYVGIHEIDRQHLELAALFNQLADSLHSASVNGCVRAPSLPLVVQLLDETRKHFKDEERIMQKYNYPDLLDHHREHVMLLAELRDFIREIQAERRSIDLNSLTALKHWLINHVIDVDLAFARFLERS